MSYKNIYTVLRDSDDPSADYEVVKMDRDWEVEETYIVSASLFSCSGTWCVTRSTCRHRQIAQVFINENKVNSRKAYDYDKERWVEQPSLEV